jgi:hypothetical protein
VPEGVSIFKIRITKKRQDMSASSRQPLDNKVEDKVIYDVRAIMNDDVFGPIVCYPNHK